MSDRSPDFDVAELIHVLEQALATLDANGLTPPALHLAHAIEHLRTVDLPQQR